MKRLHSLLFAILLLSQCAFGQDIDGTWKGVLDAGTAKLTIVFHIMKDNGGKTVCKMDSPDQGAKGIAANVVFVSSDSLNVAIPSLGVSYSGHLRDNIIKGVFSQAGYNFVLDLNKGEYGVRRPQTPVAPLPYKTEEVTFCNRDDGAVLAGTLTYPVGYALDKAKKKVPVVLMVTGSGLQNRDEEVFDHKPFLVIADFLARNGIASLRYDDRGCGQSTGNATTATTMTFMKDAHAGLDFLRSLGLFGRTGVLGHSEGGTIAFMLGKEKCADFVVSMAGAAVRGDKILVEQNRVALMFAGIAAETAAGYCDVLEKIYECKNSGKGAETPTSMVEDIIKDSGKDIPYSLKANLMEVMKMDNVWLNHFIKYDPAEDIKGTMCPVFAANGSLDTQVLAKQNIPAIKLLLPKGKYNVVKEYPRLNHLFQNAVTGNISEYNKIEETISQDVLHDIASWINTLK